MNETFEWILMLAAIVIGIVGAVNKNRKKAEAERKSGGLEQTEVDQGTDAGYGRTPKPVRKTLAERLIELAEQTADPDTASPMTAPRPIATPAFPMTRSKSGGNDKSGSLYGESAKPAPISSRTATPLRSQPEATSHDYYSLEAEYDGMDGRGGMNRPLVGTRVVSTLSAGEVSSGTITDDAADYATGANDACRASLAKIFGDEFDLRRAVIEAEILNPKYI